MIVGNHASAIEIQEHVHFPSPLNAKKFCSLHPLVVGYTLSMVE